MIYTKSKNTYIAVAKDNPKDRIEIEVGDSKQPGFKPQQKIMRWGNEVNVSLRLVHDEVNPTVSKSGEKITWEGEKVKAEIYPLTEGEGGQEFEITLKEKPKSNVVQFTLVDKGVEYFYQPFLKNTNPDGSFWEENEGGRSECPANVGGSYAIYASENKVNYVGGKEYKCGKVGHIYRPRIEDANGDWVWGELNIKDGILSVTIPQKFLDNAVYPVRHAAGLTFGYETAGTSVLYLNNYIWSSKYTSSESGTVTSLTFRGATDVSTVQLGIYLFSNYSLVGNTSSITNIYNTTWTSKDLVSSASITATDYLLAVNGNSLGNCRIRHDNFSDSNSTRYNSQAFGTWPNPATLYQYSSYKYKLSIYATYTAGGTTGPANLKSYNTNLKANIKSINTNLLANVKSLNTNV